MAKPAVQPPVMMMEPNLMPVAGRRRHDAPSRRIFGSRFRRQPQLPGYERQHGIPNDANGEEKKHKSAV